MTLQANMLSAFYILRNLVAITVFLAVISVCHGIVCPPNFCETADCRVFRATDCNGNQEYIPSGTFCGCCDMCLDYLNLGDECRTEKLPIQGVPQHIPKCKPGTACIGGHCSEIN